MKFTIQQKIINKAISKIIGIVDKKAAIPFLSNIKVETKEQEITFTGTDMDIFIEANISISNIVQIGENGHTTVQAHILHDIIKKIPEEDNLTIHLLENKSIKLTYGKSIFSIPTIASDEFPTFSKDKMDVEFSVNNKEFSRAIEQTRFAISHDETKPFLNGTFFQINNEGKNGVFNAVAIDGHKLALSKFIIKDFSDKIPSIIVPKKTINELKKIIDEDRGEVKINFSKLKINVSYNGNNITSKIIDADFPEYQKIIPKNNDIKIVLNKKEIFSTIDRVSTMVDGKHNAITMIAQNNKLIFEAMTAEGGKAVEEINIEDIENNFKIAFNARYLLEIIHQFDEDRINFKFKDGQTPVLIDSDRGLDSYVIMPIRL
jgi:DNA polymerase-3 subunit beta